MTMFGVEPEVFLQAAENAEDNFREYFSLEDRVLDNVQAHVCEAVTPARKLSALYKGNKVGN